MRMSMENKRKSFILFGAGYYGEEALWYYGTANVAYFCDNKKSGKIVKGISVIPFQKLCEVWQDYEVVVTALENPARSEITKQLEENEISYSFYTAQQFKIQKDNFAGEYAWMNCSRKSEKLLLVLAGYKSYLWNSVFGRLRKFVPRDFDICILTAGYKNTELAERCEKEGWSYLYSKENKPALVMNCAVKEHPNAKWIFKMDEDIFVTDGVFETLKKTYQQVEESGRYTVGFVAPLVPVNGYGHVRLLELFDAVDLWEKRFGALKYSDCFYHHRTIWKEPEAACFMWGEDNPKMGSLDQMQTILQKKALQYSVCPIRYSIGFILFRRENWIKMETFPVLEYRNMGADEEWLCQFCMMQARAMVIAENAVVGHLSYGAQNQVMEQFYYRHREKFSLPRLS